MQDKTGQPLIGELERNNYPNCSRWIAKSGGYGLNLAIQAERRGTLYFFRISCCGGARCVGL